MVIIEYIKIEGGLYMNTKYEKIFQTFTFPSGVEVKNRIMVAPMTNYSSHDNGEVSEAELAYYKERTGGGAHFLTLGQ